VAFDFNAWKAFSVEYLSASGTGSAVLSGKQLVGTFTGEMHYSLSFGNYFLQNATCRATDHTITFTPRR